MERDTELYRAAAEKRAGSAHEPRMPNDRVAEAEEALRAATAGFLRDVRGADPQLDAALADLGKLESYAATELEIVRRMDDEASRGVRPPGEANERAVDVAAEADRRYTLQARAAERALEAAREAVIGTLLPEPAFDTATDLRQKEIGMLLTAASKAGASPGAAFETVFRDRARSGDRPGISVLLSGWGRASFLAAGGSETAWNELRHALALAAAQGPLKDSPVAERVRKLYSPSANKAYMAASANASSAVERLKKRSQR